MGGYVVLGSIVGSDCATHNNSPPVLTVLLTTLAHP